VYFSLADRYGSNLMNLWLLVGNGIKNWIQSEDLAIVDRGFRDATEFLKTHGLHVEMPSYLKKGT
jgi:RNAse (barnase) inhibitor barstar